jgi:hypothetical protein
MGWYLRAYQAVKRARWRWERIKEEAAGFRAVVEAVRGSTAVVIAVGAAFALLRGLDHLFVEHAHPWLIQYATYAAATAAVPDVSAPSIRASLLASAALIGGILAVFVAISLLTIELSSDKYSPQVVRYLLNEATTRRLLAFLLFAALLALVQALTLGNSATTHTVSVLTTVLVAAIAVVSILTYQRHALVLSLPIEAIDQITRETIRELRSVARTWDGAGSLDDITRRSRVSQRIRLIGHFGAMLVEEEKYHEEAGAAIANLASVLGEYGRQRRRIKSTRDWFPTREVLVSEEDSLIVRSSTQLYRRLGLGPPRKSETMHDWLEEMTLREMETLVLDGLEAGSPHCVEAYAESIPELIEATWHEEEVGLFNTVIASAQSVIDEATQRDEKAAAERVLDCLLTAAYVPLRGANRKELESLDGIDLHDAQKIVEADLRAIGVAELLQTREKLRTELAAYGRQVTPSRIVRDQVRQAVSRQQQRFAQEIVAKTWQILAKAGTQDLARGRTDMAVDCARGLLMLYKRCGLEQVAVESELVDDMAVLLTQLGRSPNLDRDAIPEFYYEIKETAFDAVHRGDTELLQTLLPVYVRLCIQNFPEKTLADMDRFMTDITGICSYLFGYGHLRRNQRDIDFATLGFVQWVPMEWLVEWYDRFFRLGAEFKLTTLPRRSLEYHERFQDLVRDVHELPEDHVHEDGAMGLYPKKRHASPFIRDLRWDAHWDDFYEGFIRRAMQALVMPGITQALEERATEMAGP